MPELPPNESILEALQFNIIPAAGGAALVMCLLLLFGRWIGALGSAVAVAFGFLCANFMYTEFSWEPPGRLVPWSAEETDPGWKWLVPAALLLVVVGLVTRWVGMIAAHYLPERRWWIANGIVWIPRLAAVIYAADWMTLGKAAEEYTALWPITAAAMFLIWVALDNVARQETSGEVALYLAFILIASSIVLFYAHSARATELALAMASALLGVGLAACVGCAKVSGAIPAAVVFLPGLVLAGRAALPDHKVPDASFWLLTLAPLVLLPFLLPALAKRDAWYYCAARTVLILIPVVIAVVLAGQNEEFVYQEW